MVRCASGVTRTRQRAVGGPSVAGGETNSTPMALMSWAKTSPSWSSRTLPTKPARPPRAATPATVLAAEPPDDSVPGPMASYSRPAWSVSISRIEPLSSSCRTRKASSVWAITSTMALPTATTSRSAGGMAEVVASSHRGGRRYRGGAQGQMTRPKPLKVSGHTRSTRTTEPVYGASIISPPPMYMPTW